MTMAKVRFYCNSGANAMSCREEVVDPAVDWGLEEGEWESLLEEEKQRYANEWAWDRLEIGYEELA